MKKIIYFLILLFAISACKYDENPYSFTREFDGGTYITPDGKVKFISGKKDSLLYATDQYAVIQENITYVKKAEGGNGILNDSILIYGHVYSKDANPVIIDYNYSQEIDKAALYENLDQRCNYFSKAGQNSVPIYSGNPENDFITEDDIYNGAVFESSFGLDYEEDYYVRSFVITGYFDGVNPVYKDIAYNQKVLKFTTGEPNDLWVGGGMTKSPASFPDNIYWGATSFSYDGYMFVVQGHQGESYESNDKIIIYRYNPINNEWDTPYKQFDVNPSFTEAVCFVIENLNIENNTPHDYLYIGSGSIDGTNDVNDNFYRLELDTDTDKPIGEWGKWQNITGNSTFDSQFPIPAKNSVAFSIGKIGYVGLGSIAGTAIPSFYKYNPSDNKSAGQRYGKWTPTTDFLGGDRTKSIVFKINNEVYIGCGEDISGTYYSDLYKCTQSNTDNLVWTQKASLPDDTLARVSAVSFALGENGYIGLGKNFEGNALSDFWRYNPFTDRWDVRAEFGLRDMDPDLGDDNHTWVRYGDARYEAIGVGIKISDNDYRAYVGTGWGTTYPDSLFNDIWEYRQ